MHIRDSETENESKSEFPTQEKSAQFDQFNGTPVHKDFF